MLLGICLILICLLGWSVVSFWEMQQALRWWSAREAIEQAAQSNKIQNGLIQDLFALRLNLQFSLSQPIEKQRLQQQAWLVELGKMYSHLNNLSIMLSPPYLAENLPLAIRSRLQQWLASHPSHQLTLDLPHIWQQDSLERNYIILSSLETLLKLAVPSSLSNAELEISLTDRSRIELVVKIIYPTGIKSRSITCIRELKYLRSCFCCLAPGRCHYQHQSNEAIWQFQWRRCSGIQ